MDDQQQKQRKNWIENTDIIIDRAKTVRDEDNEVKLLQLAIHMKQKLIEWDSTIWQ